jgi:hypothetical protein
MKLAFLARYEDAEKVHQNAPTSMLKSRIKRGGEGLGGLSRVGKEGIGVWPTQKLSRGAPYELPT